MFYTTQIYRYNSPVGAFTKFSGILITQKLNSSNSVESGILTSNRDMVWKTFFFIKMKFKLRIIKMLHNTYLENV